MTNCIRKPIRHIFATIWRICSEYIFLHSQGYYSQLDTNSAVILGTSEHSRKVMLKPIYIRQTWSSKASALRLINRRVLTGCDTIEHTLYTEKEKGCFTTFRDASPTVLAALTELGECAEPSVEVVNGGEEFLCSFCCPKQLHITPAKTVRWHIFKQLKPDQGVDKLQTTQSVWLEHIRRAQVEDLYSDTDTQSLSSFISSQITIGSVF